MIQQFFAFTKKIIIRLDGWTGCSNDKKFSQNLQQFNLTHLVPVVHGTHHSEGASLLHLHNLWLNLRDSEGGGHPHQEQTGDEKFHSDRINISLVRLTGFLKTMPVVWCRCDLSI